MSEPIVLQLLRDCRYEALHLELRDTYDETESRYLQWRREGRVDPDLYAFWPELIRSVVARGVRVRRARVVSEPVTDYVRYEHAITPAINLAGGEEVRWLPRQQASTLLVPGNESWVFDARTVVFNNMAGDGSWATPHENRVDDPVVATRIVAAFEAVWAIATPHEHYHPA